MRESPEDRVDAIASDLIRDRRLRLRPGDATEKAAISTAAQLTAAGRGPQRMTAPFRRQMAASLENAPRGPWLTRRAALIGALGAAAGAVAATSLGRIVEGARKPLERGPTIDPTNPRWVDVGALTDFPEGQGRLVRAGAVGAYLFRRGTKVSAVSSICTHLPCELEWQGAEGVLNCPCHGRTFAPDGTAVGDAYPLPSLSVVSVRVTTDQRVEVMGA